MADRKRMKAKAASNGKIAHAIMLLGGGILGGLGLSALARAKGPRG